MSVFRRCVLSGSKSEEILYFERETTPIFAVLESIDDLITEQAQAIITPVSKFSDFSNLVFIHFVLHHFVLHRTEFITIVLTKYDKSNTTKSPIY